MSTVESVINNYFQAYMQADSAKISEAFHADTRLLSVDEGKLDVTPLPAWLDNLRARKEKGDIRKGQLNILSVDQTADTATAKLTIQLPTMQFTDYLSLLRIDGQWKIVGKIYSVKN